MEDDNNHLLNHGVVMTCGCVKFMLAPLTAPRELNSLTIVYNIKCKNPLFGAIVRPLISLAPGLYGVSRPNNNLQQ